MNKLRNLILHFLIVLLFARCQAGVPVRTQVESGGIEDAFVAGKWNDVITLGEKRLEKEPENVVVHFVLRMAYYMKGDYELQERERSLALEDEKDADVVVAWCEQLVQRFS